MRNDPGDVTLAHRLYFGLLGAASAGLGLAGLLRPGASALPPLHARCLGAMLAAQALTWLLATRERDSACVRIPLAQAVTTALAALLAPLLRGEPLAGAVALAALVAAGGGSALLWHDRALQAPAERADAALAATAVLLGLATAALALAPAWSALAWPWALPPRAAQAYAAVFAAWSAGAAMLALERRRAGRRLTLIGLCGLGLGVAVVSLAHLPAFHQPAGAAAWIAVFLALAVLAALRLRPRHFALHPAQH